LENKYRENFLSVFFIAYFEQLTNFCIKKHSAVGTIVVSITEWLYGAEGGSRTHTRFEPHWILSSISQKEPLGTEWND